MSDLADKLNIKALPIPTEQRLDVFVCYGLPDEALARWQSQAGTSVFHTAEVNEHPEDWGKDLSQHCGIALFMLKDQRGVREGYLTPKNTSELQPFYDRAGAEANVFQWQPIEKNFVRRDYNWFREHAS